MSLFDRLRLGLLTKSMAIASRNETRVTVAGIRLTVAPGVCHPAPGMGLSFAPLFEAALEGIQAGDTVLDIGTGTGIWGLIASRAGAAVTATDLAHVPLDVVRRTAEDNGIPCPDLRHGSLFEPVTGERFDRVLFNPPFHFGEPTSEAEKATLGGADGEVVKSFLGLLPSHLEPGGAGYAILPRAEQAGYAEALANAVPVATLRIPVMGPVSLFRIAAEVDR
ncbi:MAG: methyltransferase [Sandaracinaceae bacterium]